MTHRLLLLFLGLLVLVIGAQASAQTSRPDPRPASDAAASPVPKGLLAGPQVDETALEAGGAAFGARERDRRASSLPPNRWFELFRALDLDDAQRAEARRIARSFVRARREFGAEHGDELRRINRQVQSRRAEGRPVDASDRERRRELEARRPRPLPYQRQLWKLLNGDQQEELRGQIASERQRMARRRAGRRDRSDR